MSTTTRITTEQYHEMIRQGAFVTDDDRRFELLEGEIVTTSAVGPSHIWLVYQLMLWATKSFDAAEVMVRIQAPFEIPDLDSEPEPIFSVARGIDYEARIPTPEEILLIIEVSDSTLPRDQGQKSSLYARAGIGDYWIVDVRDQSIEVRRDPHGDTYRTIQVYQPGQEIRPLAFPETIFPVSLLFRN